MLFIAAISGGSHLPRALQSLRIPIRGRGAPCSLRTRLPAWQKSKLFKAGSGCVLQAYRWVREGEGCLQGERAPEEWGGETKVRPNSGSKRCRNPKVKRAIFYPYTLITFIKGVLIETQIALPKEATQDILHRKTNNKKHPLKLSINWHLTKKIMLPS